ncbi:MAG: hypothetical protein ACI84C_000385 [Flavobacteriales bacterium]|jgi:hypothetical protein
MTLRPRLDVESSHFYHETCAFARKRQSSKNPWTPIHCQSSILKLANHSQLARNCDIKQTIEMKYFIYTALFILSVTGTMKAQPDSEIFPDFTLEDIDENTQNLYSFLDDGKYVIIDIFTTWCPNCINSLPGIEEIWETHGPAGDNSVMLLSFERDVSTSDELEFIADHNITNPVIIGAEALIADTWNIPYQPNFFVICPDRTWHLRVGGIGSNATILTNLFENCQTVTSVEETGQSYLALPVNTVIETSLQIDSFEENLVQYSIVGMNGQIADRGALTSGTNNIDFIDFNAGIYVIQLVKENQMQTFKIIKK